MPVQVETKIPVAVLVSVYKFILDISGDFSRTDLVYVGQDESQQASSSEEIKKSESLFDYGPI